MISNRKFISNNKFQMKFTVLRPSPPLLRKSYCFCPSVCHNSLYMLFLIFKWEFIKMLLSCLFLVYWYSSMILDYFLWSFWLLSIVLWLWIFLQHIWGVRVMVFNATFNNISVISWWSVLLVEETVVPRENHRPVVSHW